MADGGGSCRTLRHLLLHLQCLFFFSLFSFSVDTDASLYRPPPELLSYHNGALLEGPIPLSLLWYGTFTPSQKSIVVDFLLSLTPPPLHLEPSSSSSSMSSARAPPVRRWWETVDDMLQRAGRRKTHIFVGKQISDGSCSMGKLLDRTHIAELAERSGSDGDGGIAIVLTAEDVAVEGFCMSHCGFHAAALGGAAYIWVGDAAAQCPGQCAWPFHLPIYGPDSPPALVPPNGDVGADGMVINVAKLIAGTVTNPLGDGYFQGGGGGVEVAAACPGVYGRGAYPGYAGELPVDQRTGGSYNVVGRNGREFLVPAMFDPSTSTCSPMV